MKLLLCVLFLRSLSAGNPSSDLRGLVRNVTIEAENVQKTLEDGAALFKTVAESEEEIGKVLELRIALRTTTILKKSFEQLACTHPWRFLKPNLCLFHPVNLEGRWHSSSNFCKVIGGELPLPMNNEEAATMLKFSRTMAEFGYFWLNIRRAPEASAFSSGNGKPLRFHPPWRQGRPRTERLSEETCATFYTELGQMKLLDTSCENGIFPFFCQKTVRQESQSAMSMILPRITSAVNSIESQLSIDVGEGRCEAPWTLVRPKLCLFFPRLLATWNATFTACRAFDGVFAMPESIGEAEAIYDFLKTQIWKWSVWINFHRPRGTVKFATENGRSPQWIPWAEGHPKNETEERCAYLYIGGEKENVSFGDITCHSQHYFLCRKQSQ